MGQASLRLFERDGGEPKLCRKCGTTRTTSDFFARSTSHDGLSSECKVCSMSKQTSTRRALRISRAGTTPTHVDKVCPRCGLRNRFSVDRGSADGLRSICAPCGALIAKERRQFRDPRTGMLGDARRRAKRAGLPCEITVEDITIPTLCPVLGIPMTLGRGSPHDSSPSLDKIVKRFGYVPGNVVVISYLANRIKSNATAAQLMRVAKWFAEEEGQVLRRFHVGLCSS